VSVKCFLADRTLVKVELLAWVVVRRLFVRPSVRPSVTDVAYCG